VLGLRRCRVASGGFRFAGSQCREPPLEHLHHRQAIGVRPLMVQHGDDLTDVKGPDAVGEAAEGQMVVVRDGQLVAHWARLPVPAAGIPGVGVPADRAGTRGRSRTGLLGRAFVVGAPCGFKPGVGGDGPFFLLLDEPEVYGLPPNPHVPTRDAPAMWRRAGAAAATFLLAGVAAWWGARR
jgi:hypothetical protein